MGVIRVKYLGLQPYELVYHQMQTFTQQRTLDTPDEIWLLQHLPVFTLGRNSKQEHILRHSHIPEIQIDRGGQVTHHAPGQLVMYVLLDLKRRNLGVRQLVSLLENCVIHFLQQNGIVAKSKKTAPGVYVDGKKIAALGLRVSKGRCYHGLCLNVAMDLMPYQQINPCGYADLQVTQCVLLGIDKTMEEVTEAVLGSLLSRLDMHQENIKT
ncbi:MAG: lipoyl(octanoyl) transferase LipB [Endozoicomonadaceae bacterium]|nr:lipoyl(octanoyl) transferase LipB [Endozoicomonadaceae bacterium]